MSARIHPTAVVEEGAELGAGVEVGPHAVVEAGAVVGDGCVLGPHVHLHGCVRLGADVRVGTGSALGGPPQDVKYRGEASRVTIGPGARIFEHVTVHRGTGEGSETVVGPRAMLMAGSHVGHDCVLEEDVTLVNGVLLAGHVRVGARAILSGGTAVHQFCRVGRLALLSGAMTGQDSPPFSIVTGVLPARWRGVNTVGMRRAGLDAEVRTAVRRALVAVLASGGSTRAAATELREHPVAEVREVAEFVLASKRGVVVWRPSARGVAGGRRAGADGDDGEVDDGEVDEGA